MVWFYPTYHERYCTSACNKVRERRKWWKTLSAFVFLRLQRQLLVFTWTCKKITLKSLALIAPRKETQIHIEVRQIWPVLYWSNCGQNFLQNKKLCRKMKKRPFSRVLSLKNGLFWSKCGDSNSVPPGPKRKIPCKIRVFEWFLMLFNLKSLLSCALSSTVST